MNYNLGDIVLMKKQHPCQNFEFIITRVGVDFKIKCLKCKREIMMTRQDFEKRVKKLKTSSE